MSASQPAYFHLQEFSDGGIPLLSGRLYTYTQGTTAFKTAYTDPAGAVPHTYTADGLGGQYIALNARGELPAPLYLTLGAYDIALKRSDGSTVWTRRADPTVDGASTGASLIGAADGAAGALFTTVAGFIAKVLSSAGASLIGFLQDGVGTILRTLQSKAGERVSVEDYGPTGNGNDDTAVIQKAINDSDGELWFTKKSYRVDGQLVWKNGVTYRGKGIRIFGIGGTKITFNANNVDASIISNPLNTSTPANVHWENLYLYAPNLAQFKSVIWDTGSTYGTLKKCRIYSSGDGLTLDQSELWDIEHTSFLLAAATSVGIWIVNGPDKQAGSNPYYTNRIGVRSCDFNGAAGSTAIRDDGGVAHTFENNNYNACGSHIIATGVTSLKIDGGEFEVSSAQSIILGLTKRKGGAGAKSPVVSIMRTYLYNNVSQPVLAMVAGAVGKLNFTDNVVNTVPGAAVTGLTVGCDEINARDNCQVGTVAPDSDLNNHIDVSPAPVDWLASVASPSIGNGALIGSYSRRGKLLTFRQRVTIGSTTTLGTGSYLFPLPFPADPSLFAQLGVCLITSAGISFYTGVARVTSDGLKAELYINAASTVGAAVPGALAAGSTIEFQITYATAAPI